jgi:single-strand DNA-binding protein
MRLASNRYYKQDSGFEKEVSFFDVESWARLAEACYNKGRKGRGVRVVGRLKEDRWNGADGKPHSRITIVAEHVEFRPEFKKDESTKPVEQRPLVDSDSPYEEDYSDEEIAGPVLAMAEKELEPVTF